MKDIPGYEGIYACDIHGNVYSLERIIMKSNGWSDKKSEWKLPFKKLSPATKKDGYLHVHLRKDGKGLLKLVHRLIAKTFLNCNTEEVNHKDGNKINNYLENLELSSRSHNIKHAFRLGFKTHKGENHPRYFIDKALQDKVCIMLKEGISQQKIANTLGINQTSVSKINIKRKVRIGKHRI